MHMQKRSLLVPMVAAVIVALAAGCGASSVKASMDAPPAADAAVPPPAADAAVPPPAADAAVPPPAADAAVPLSDGTAPDRAPDLAPDTASGPGVFATTGDMLEPRESHAAVLLANGRVLIVGGHNDSGYLASAELYDPATGAFTATGAMTTDRDVPTATLLASGLVYVAGGSTMKTDGGTNPYLRSAELYDPAAGTFTATDTMHFNRQRPSATLLDNGKVLVAGGYGGPDATKSFELYDPATGTSSEYVRSGGLMSGPRYGHTAVRLANSQVLIVCGTGTYDNRTTELYDPVSNTFARTGELTTPRTACTATLLGDERVLVTSAGTATDSAELFDPQSGTFTATGAMTLARAYPTAASLPSGKVLVAGGTDGTVALQAAETYDPATGTFTATASMHQARLGHTATTLANGKVLIAGGYDGSSHLAGAELYF